MSAVVIGLCVFWSVDGFLLRYQPRAKLLRLDRVAEEKSRVKASTKDEVATIWSGTRGGGVLVCLVVDLICIKQI